MECSWPLTGPALSPSSFERRTMMAAWWKAPSNAIHRTAWVDSCTTSHDQQTTHLGELQLCLYLECASSGARMHTNNSSTMPQNKAGSEHHRELPQPTGITMSSTIGVIFEPTWGEHSAIYCLYPLALRDCPTSTFTTLITAQSTWILLLLTQQ